MRILSTSMYPGLKREKKIKLKKWHAPSDFKGTNPCILISYTKEHDNLIYFQVPRIKKRKKIKLKRGHAPSHFKGTNPCILISYTKECDNLIYFQVPKIKKRKKN